MYRTEKKDRCTHNYFIYIHNYISPTIDIGITNPPQIRIHDSKLKKNTRGIKKTRHHKQPSSIFL